MRIQRAAISFSVLVLLCARLAAEDFTLWQGKIGPIRVHTEITYEGKGERISATATNDSGIALQYIRFCVISSIKGCLFTMWNTATWEPGTELSWNTTTARRVPELAHEVKIDALNLPNSGVGGV